MALQYIMHRVCSGRQQASPHPGGTTTPNSRVNPGRRGGCRCFVVGAAAATCCPAPGSAAGTGTASKAKQRAAPAPRAGDFSQTRTWLLSIRISIRRRLCSPQARHATVKGGPDPSLGRVLNFSSCLFYFLASDLPMSKK